MFTLNELIQAFDNNLHYAWEVLYSEILMETFAINTDYLRKLIILYSKGVQRCNHLQTSGQNYFKMKINQLMGQKKVIQCLHDQKDLLLSNTKIDNKSTQDNDAMMPKKKISLPLNINPALQARRKQIQMRLAYDIQESKSSRVSKMLKQEKFRQQKIQNIVVKCMNSEEQKLQRKIQQRKQRASISNNKMGRSLKLSMSGISTYGEGIDSYQNLDNILDEIPFIESPDDPYL